ncbi:MAG: hypothetical protein LBQ47_00495 [Endomicrobium sp.]|nr:hypothetical protein [Endomicrobium sp.]
MKTNIKNVFLNKISVLIFLSAAALLLTAFLYFCFLKAVGGYSNLDDFISGYSIWTNLNKHIDLLIPYIYSFVFFALYIPLRRFIEKLPFFVFFWQNFISRAINKAASFFLWKNEKLPFWKKAVLLFSAVFIVYLLASSGYNYLSIPPDHFHFGEKLLAYWLTADGAAQMYETFYPIHGFKDIIPGFLSKFLGDNYASGSIIGMQILYNICLIGVSLTVLSIFPFFMSLIILLPLSFIKALPFIAMIVLFKDNFAFRAYPKWLILYCIFGICLYCFEFTSGIPFTLAMLPLCIYGLFNYYKTVPQKKFFLNIGVIFLLLLLFFIIFKDFFLNNFKFILDFAKYNTAAFGNLGHDESRNLPLYVLILVSKLAYKSPVYFLLPIFAILFIKSLKNKEMSAAFFFAAMTIYLAASTSYALARFDLEMGRAQNISMCFIYLLIPACLYFNRRHGGGG